MAAVELLCHLAGIDPCKFSKEENMLLEAELFSRISENLMGIFKEQYQEYFRLMKLTCEKENAMLDANFAYLIIKDILSTEEYTLAGIAKYADTHEDVITEIIAQCDIKPSASVLRRLIELHRSVRPELYDAIIKKIIAEYLVMAQKQKAKRE